ncbi:histidine phosphatase family protein [Nocardioides ginsengisoli]|uniref:Histidine phosphatase family protein n=1 Tax=Nocardioides ginsengisoli TaxID=363868 RepID=A0ABW3VWN0_9ACTN
MTDSAFLVRHGATEWSESGRHTSSTDKPLLPAGEQLARELRIRLDGPSYREVLTSPLLRARRTAELAGFEHATVVDDLLEWDYGDYEGMTTAQIRADRPDWSLWTDGCPGGETPEQVEKRVDRVVDHIRLTGGDVLIFAHGHVLRALTARWLGLPVRDGALFRLDTATISQLGYERETAVIQRWNA